MSPTYEWLRDTINRIAPSDNDSRRTIQWADEGCRIGLARDQNGQIEVFIACPPLSASTSIVRDLLEFQRWFTTDGLELDANRFVLPSGSHFDAVAALICVELIAAGALLDPIGAFYRTEPVIALALRRAAMSNESLVGLAGELIFLNALLMAVPAASCHDVVEAWAGSGPSTRDFQLGTVGIEVKTTAGSASSHFIHGLGQVELGQSVNGEPETLLFLLSLGLRWLDSGSAGFSIPDLVDSVLSRLPDSDAQTDLIARIQQYGGEGSVRYEHFRDRLKPMFRRRFELRFERLYDMTDPDVLVLRAPMINGLDHINHDSISFRIQLPNQVRGDLNPTANLTTIVPLVLGHAGVPPVR